MVENRDKRKEPVIRAFVALYGETHIGASALLVAGFLYSATDIIRNRSHMSEHIEKGNWIRRHPFYTALIVVFGSLFALAQIGMHTDEYKQSQAEDARAQQETSSAQDKLAAQQALQIAQMEQKQKKEWEASKEGKICDAHPDWSRAVCTLVAAGKVSIGMTAEQAKAAWGTPEDVNRTVTAMETSEQWVYDGNYLYFDDGVLTSIQN